MKFILKSKLNDINKNINEDLNIQEDIIQESSLTDTDLKTIEPDEFASWISEYHLKNFAVAVSGGPDSVCLLRLLYRHLQHTNISLSNMTVLTVDHCQRGEESRGETQWVEALCKQLGIKCHVLIAQLEPDSNQENSRRARYNLLTQWCIENNCRDLYFAHNSDDQIETFFMRLNKASSFLGLSCMRIVSVVSGVKNLGNLKIIRPLLRSSKERLLSTLKGLDQSYMVDSSNNSSDYTRNKIRLEGLALDNNALLISIHKMLKIRQWLESDAHKFISNNFVIKSDNTIAYVREKDLLRLDTLLGAKVLQDVVRTLHGNRSSRTEDITRFGYYIQEYANNKKNATFAGVIFRSKDGVLSIKLDPRVSEKGSVA